MIDDFREFFDGITFGEVAKVVGIALAIWIGSACFMVL
jgi:hypothetical protein